MNQAKKFFIDNSNRLNAHQDPVAWNTNNGLLALSEAVEALAQDIRRIDHQNEMLLRALQALSPGMR